MTLDVAGVLRDAWSMAKRDRQILVAVAGLLIFVPQWGAFLFMTPQPPFPPAGAQAPAIELYRMALSAWLAANLPLFLLASVAALIARIALTLLYVDAARPDVAGALTAAPRRFFPALLVILLCSPIVVALQISPVWLILPAAWLGGRLSLSLPILLGERPMSALRAIAASWRRTGRYNLVAAGLACIPVVGGYLFALLFLLVGQGLSGAALRNPVVAAVLYGGASFGVTLGMVATILVQVALYRRLSSGT